MAVVFVRRAICNQFCRFNERSLTVLIARSQSNSSKHEPSLNKSNIAPESYTLNNELSRSVRLRQVLLDRKKPKDEADSWLCTAYSTSESYNLHALKDYFMRSGSPYYIASLPKDALDVLHISKTNKNQTEASEVFFFRRLGAFVCWNMEEHEMISIRHIVSKFQSLPYSDKLIDSEVEQLLYQYTNDPSNLVSGTMLLNDSKSDETLALEKYAFSNALALSVKLAIWENNLERLVDSMRYIPEVLKLGMRLKLSRKDVMQYTGELLSLRHQINLYSDLLMTPDFYWDRENVEHLYNKMCNYLDINRRTKVTNEKFNLCSEMVEIIRSHLNEKQSLRLEWIIIILIAVEILFECAHYVNR